MPMEITYRPLADLAPADRNPRTHSASNLKAIERSTGTRGWPPRPPYGTPGRQSRTTTIRTPPRSLTCRT
jgi:hypothetical protein